MDDVNDTINLRLRQQQALDRYRLIEQQKVLRAQYEILRKSFPAFIKQTFRTVSPAHEYVHNWHIDAISEYLEACRNGDIKRLIINMPPRSLKSISVAVAWPAWLLGQNPATQVMCSSYSRSLSEKHSVDTRTVINSRWYSKTFPETSLSNDQATKGKFVTTARGQRYAVSTGSAATGEGADFCLPDGELVNTPSGLVPVELIKTGDIVLSFDHQQEKVVECRVNGTAIKYDEKIYEIHTSTGHSIRCTGNHPIFEAKRGCYVEAERLSIGDELYVLEKASEQQVSCSNFLHILRSMWKKPPKTALCFEKVTQYQCHGDLLQRFLPINQKRREVQEALPNLQKNDAAQKGDSALLLRRMQENGSFGETLGQNTDMPRVSWDVSKKRECTHAKVLLSILCRRQPFAQYAREEEQQSPNTAPKLLGLELLQENAPYNIGEGRECLCCMSHLDEERNSIGRKKERDYACSSYRRKHEKQQPEKPINPLQRMSQTPPLWKTDRITSISITCGTPQRVNDIEVIGTHNFFAGGILVHNCIVDDPVNPQQAASDTERNTANDHFDQTLTSRLNDKRTGVMVVVMQRLHEDDLSGHLLEKGGWEHLCLQAMAEKTTHISMGNFERTVNKGDLLDPVRLDHDVLVKTKNDMGEYAYAGQYQQNPAPSEGGILKKAWWRKWLRDAPPECFYIIQSLDTAYGEKQDGDLSAITTWGLFNYEGTDGDKRVSCILLDAEWDTWSYPDLKAAVLKSYKRHKPDRIIIEGKASGLSLLADLRKAGLPVTKFKVENDKITRAHVSSILLEKGHVFYMERDWSDRVRGDCAVFPNGRFDDIVDTCTQAWLYMRKRYWLNLSDDDSANDKKIGVAKPAKKTFYGSSGM